MIDDFPPAKKDLKAGEIDQLVLKLSRKLQQVETTTPAHLPLQNPPPVSIYSRIDPQVIFGWAARVVRPS